MRMLIFWTLMVGLFSILPAQRGFKVGFFGVPQVSFLMNEDDRSLAADQYSPEALPTMAGGISLGVGFTDNFGLRFSPTLAQQGQAYTALTEGDITTRFVERLNYFKLPLMIGFNTTPTARKFIYSLYLGASVDLLTQARSFNDNPFFFIPSNVSIPPARDRYLDLAYSFIAETGFDVQLPPENFTLNLRLRGDYGLTDVENKDVTYRVVTNGQVETFRYWGNLRGENRTAVTQALNLGLLIGLTYAFE